MHKSRHEVDDTRTAASDNRRQQIRDAALTLFSQFGFRGARLEAIAEQAGVSKSNLLYHFTSKRLLYIAVLRHILDSWLSPMRNFQADQSAQVAIAQYIRVKLVLSRDRSEASRLFCLEMMQGAPLLKEVLAGELRELVREKSRVIETWIENGELRPVDPHHLFYLLWGATQHYADFAVQIEAVSGHTLENPAFFETAVRTVQRVVLGGLTPSPTDLDDSDF
ncbi:HTH-type transcriptional regulator RutR [Salinicola aestuarinus]|uniref:HTH-type transcriptional regulator RutR n=1 Tax=Salinicola aestuarinus TaxID=1949082 RepID=UPI000DA1220A|nr:HTH-type transcriptional regulator RutR [Salinicola aestuarinus]